MALANQVRVGQTWIARVGGKEVRTQVLAERAGPGGRKQFQIKNLDTNRTSSKWWSAGKLRSLVASGEPGPQFAPNPAPAPAQPPEPRRNAISRKPPVARVPPRAKAPRPALEAEVFYDEEGPRGVVPSLGSLRGRGRGRVGPSPRATRPPAAPRPQAAERAAPRPQAREPHHQGYPSELAKLLCEAIMQTDGSEHALRGAVSDTVAQWRFREDQRQYNPGAYQAINPYPPGSPYGPPAHYGGYQV